LLPKSGIYTECTPAAFFVVLIFRDRHKRIIPMVTDLKAEFIEWLIDPGHVGTQEAWAKSHGISPATLSQWKKHPEFKAALNRRLGEINVDALRIQAVVNAMWDKAQQGDVKAAELYLRYIEKLQPSRPVLEDDTDVSKLSDEELLAALQTATQVLGRK
jgi:DNA-binding transcriptional regulator YdaS (Cro superfamily)